MRIAERLLRTRWPRLGRDWLLSDAERRNDATGLEAWTEGNSVRVVAHGAQYFPELARELEDTGPGDLVLVAGWRMDVEQRLSTRSSVGEALTASAERGAVVRGLVWRSHPSWIVGSRAQNKRFAQTVNHAGGRVLLDHRVRLFGSQHQKFVVIRRRSDPTRDVAFVGGLDLARSRADNRDHLGDPLPRDFAAAYGARPAWHDVQVEIRGPAVREVEETFRERWADPAPLTSLPWHRVLDIVSGLPQRADPLPAPRPAPPVQGRARVQLLRTYPHRRRGFPFAPKGEYSVAMGMVKALQHARRLVYLEDQYLWSAEVGQVLDAALRRNPHLHVIAVCPRYPDQEGHIKVPPALLGQGLARHAVSPELRNRVTRIDIETDDGVPIYVHAKLCVIDDVWASVGSANLNRRSWTHDAELTVAVLDEELDPREPADPDGRGAQARRFARELRLELLCEHLGRADGDDADLVDPDQAVRVLRDSASALDAWYDGGQAGPRPPGRLRHHVPTLQLPRLQQALATPAYKAVFDPDGRPLHRKLLRRY